MACELSRDVGERVILPAARKPVLLRALLIWHQNRTLAWGLTGWSVCDGQLSAQGD